MNFDEDNNKIGKRAENLARQEYLPCMHMALRLVPNTEKTVTNVTQVG